MAIEKAAALILDENRLLVVKKKGLNVCINAGGRIEDGESKEDALYREVEHGLNVTIKNADFYKTFESKAGAHDANKKIISHCFFVDIVGKPEPHGDVDEVLWLDGDNDNDEKLSDLLQKIVDDLKESNFL
jgi:8-oxo-dGTP diphosphatase